MYKLISVGVEGLELSLRLVQNFINEFDSNETIKQIKNPETRELCLGLIEKCGNFQNPSQYTKFDIHTKPVNTSPLMEILSFPPNTQFNQQIRTDIKKANLKLFKHNHYYILPEEVDTYLNRNTTSQSKHSTLEKIDLLTSFRTALISLYSITDQKPAKMHHRIITKLEDALDKFIKDISLELEELYRCVVDSRNILLVDPFYTLTRCLELPRASEVAITKLKNNPFIFKEEVNRFFEKLDTLEDDLKPYIYKNAVFFSVLSLISIFREILGEENGKETAKNLLESIKNNTEALLNTQKNNKEKKSFLSLFWIQLNDMVLTDDGLNRLQASSCSLPHLICHRYNTIREETGNTRFSPLEIKHANNTEDTYTHTIYFCRQFRTASSENVEDLVRFESILTNMKSYDQDSLFLDITHKYLELNDTTAKEIFRKNLYKRLPSFLKRAETIVKTLDQRAIFPHRFQHQVQQIVFLYKFLIYEDKTELLSIFNHLCKLGLEKSTLLKTTDKEDLKSSCKELSDLIEESSELYPFTLTINAPLTIEMILEFEENPTQFKETYCKLSKSQKKKRRQKEAQKAKQIIEIKPDSNDIKETQESPTPNQSTGPKKESEKSEKKLLPAPPKATPVITHKTTKPETFRKAIVLHSQAFKVYKKLILDNQSISIKEYQKLLTALKNNPVQLISNTTNNPKNEDTSNSAIIGSVDKANKTSHRKSELGIHIFDEEGKLIKTLVEFITVTEKDNKMRKYQLEQIQDFFTKLTDMGISFEQVK